MPLVFALISALILFVLMAAIYLTFEWVAYNSALNFIKRTSPCQKLSISLMRSLFEMQKNNRINFGFRVDATLFSTSQVLVYQRTDGQDVLIDVSYPVYCYLRWRILRMRKKSYVDFVLSDLQTKLEFYIEQNNATIESAVRTQHDVTQRLQNDLSPFQKDYIQSQIDVLL